uniref:NADH-ubiquinone oxidoreductase chain 4L n=1 Tax=Eulepethus nanhaiensis TaxID=1881687 RepID=A0A343W6G3_9ANNE|nr:NADH dehydrogenase subunit 4L [Eulepethus nanhaiensis]
MLFISSSLIPFSTFATIITLVIQRNHLLMALLSLEAMILTLTLLSISSTSFINQAELFFSMILLTFGACEASLGLACLVAMARSYGNDQINSLNINKC